MFFGDSYTVKLDQGQPHARLFGKNDADQKRENSILEEFPKICNKREKHKLRIWPSWTLMFRPGEMGNTFVYLRKKARTYEQGSENGLSIIE